MAAYQVALVGSYVHSPPEEQRAALEAAVRHADRSPQKERLFIRAWAAHDAGNDDEALALYREILKEFPDDKSALFLAGKFWRTATRSRRR
jgi:tetratricopeptide (TPR) repeat protein